MRSKISPWCGQSPQLTISGVDADEERVGLIFFGDLEERERERERGDNRWVVKPGQTGSTIYQLPSSIYLSDWRRQRKSKIVSSSLCRLRKREKESGSVWR
jgi:hypothetical protein